MPSTGSAHRNVWNRGFRAAIAILFVSGIVSLDSATPAGAVGGIHRVTAATMTNRSFAVERPTINYSCNDVTGKFTFKINNVQVIQSDRVTPWQGPYHVAAGLEFEPLEAHWVALEQNTTNGLFKATLTGVLTNIAACTTGTLLSVLDWVPDASFPLGGAGAGWLFFEGPLT